MRKLNQVLTPLLFVALVALTNGANAQNPAAPASSTSSAMIPLATTPQVLQQTRQLLDWLGFMPLLEEVPATLNLSLDAEARFRNATPAQVDAWRRALENRLKPQQLQTDLMHYVAERYRLETYTRVSQILQDPLSKRVRYFDLAMTQPGVAKNLPQLRADMHGEPSPERRTLIEDIDAAGAASLLTAVLQTGIAERVRIAAGAGPSDDTLLQAEIAERQRFLAPLTADYALYAYRYLRDEELAAFRDLLRDAQLQWLLDVSRQGLLAVLQGGVKPPPDSKR